MLAFHHAPASSPPFGSLPAASSPLSPRSANIYGRQHHHHHSTAHLHATRMSDQEDTKSARSGVGLGQENCLVGRKDEGVGAPFSKRMIKRAPVPKGEELREKRRKGFLEKVERRRVEGRFEMRGDDMMRLDFMQRQRAWEAERAREAALVASQGAFDADDDEEEDQSVPDYDLPGYAGSQMMQLSSSSVPQGTVTPEDEVVEDFVKGEEAELMAMLESMRRDDDDGEMDARSLDSDHLWSDDADYDEVFSEVLSREVMGVEMGQQMSAQEVGLGNRMDAQHQQQPTHQRDDDAMDMS